MIYTRTDNLNMGTNCMVPSTTDHSVPVRNQVLLMGHNIKTHQEHYLWPIEYKPENLKFSNPRSRHLKRLIGT